MINGHRVIAIEEHFATTAYLDAIARLPIWPGDETEMALMRAVQSALVMRDRHAGCGLGLPGRSRNARGAPDHERRLRPAPGMFAIDYPYEDSAPATAFLRDADLTDTQRAKISHRNAERLLRLPPALNNE